MNFNLIISNTGLLSKLFFLIIFSVVFVSPAYSKNELNNQIALKILFGRYDSNRMVFSHQLSTEDKKRFDISKSDGEIFYTDIVALKPFTEKNIKKYFVITETKNSMFDCHPCAPITGIAVLINNNNSWKIAEKHQYVERIGGWGKTPEPSVINIGKDNYGLYFEDGYTGMGIVSSWVYLIAKVDKNFKTVLKEEDYFQSNHGDCGKSSLHQCYEYNSKMDFTKNISDFYPLTVSTSGTKFNNTEKPEKFKRVKKYIFSKGKYQLKK